MILQRHLEYYAFVDVSAGSGGSLIHWRAVVNCTTGAMLHGLLILDSVKNAGQKDQLRVPTHPQVRAMAFLARYCIAVCPSSASTLTIEAYPAVPTSVENFGPDPKRAKLTQMSSFRRS